MKKGLALFLTAGVIAGSFWLSNRRDRREPDEPETVVWRMLEKSRDGNVPEYLRCFDGTTREQLERNVREMGQERFSSYLRETMSRVKGIALYDVQKPEPDRATLVVEYVYQERNERQRLSLRREQGSWRIEVAGASERIQPLIPYGKPLAGEQ